MPSREENERNLDGVVGGGLRRWLGRARDAVMAPWRQWRGQPDPAAIFALQPEWAAEVDTILTTVGRIAMAAWSEVTDAPAVSRNAFVMAQLAQTENFLVRIPDEVYEQVFAEITDAVNAGADTGEVARRVENVLTWTGSENWPNRARVIAITETTRAMNAGVQGAGMEMSRVTGRVLRKKWRTEQDERVRASHRAADDTTVDIYMPFYVGGYPLLFPGDPSGPPDEVIGCRCDLVLVNERGR